MENELKMLLEAMANGKDVQVKVVKVDSLEAIQDLLEDESIPDQVKEELFDKIGAKMDKKPVQLKPSWGLATKLEKLVKEEEADIQDVLLAAIAVLSAKNYDELASKDGISEEQYANYLKELATDMAADRSRKQAKRPSDLALASLIFAVNLMELEKADVKLTASRKKAAKQEEAKKDKERIISELKNLLDDLL